MATRWPTLGRLASKLSHFNRTTASFSHLNLTRSIFNTPALNDGVSIKMPALSPTMQEGTIVKWYKKEGDVIAPGDVLCDIQTDKAVVSFEIEEEGILAKILKPENTKDVKIGTMIGVMVEEGEDWKNVQVPVDEEATPDGPAPATAAEPPKKSASQWKAHSGAYGPAVRSLLEMYHITADEVPATGPHDRVLKGDVLLYIKNKGLKPVPLEELLATVKPVAPEADAPKPAKKPSKSMTPEEHAADYIDIPLTSMRKTIAKRLTESKASIPHAYSAMECNIEKILAIRKNLAEDGVKVSVNDFIIKAAAVALRKVPEVNASWGGDTARLQSNIDISVAVATENGLITPIVKDAVNLGIKEISSSVKELAGRAREGKLKLNEFQGGSFTISNLGMFGIREFTAVINPPQACILAVGTSRLVLDAQGHAQTVMTVTMSSDARVVDDALAAQFLEVFRDTLENPLLMMGESSPITSYIGMDREEDILEKMFRA